MKREMIGNDIFVEFVGENFIVSTKIGDFETNRIEFSEPILVKLIDYILRKEMHYE